MTRTACLLGLGSAFLLISTSGRAVPVLDAQPCSVASTLRSATGTVNQLLTINNNSSEPISFAWLDSSGREGQSAVVEASRAAFVRVAPAWAMVVRDAGGACIAVFVTQSEGGAFTIVDSMLPNRGTPAAAAPNGPARSRGPAASRPLAQSEVLLEDGSIWSIDGYRFKRVEPTPGLTISSRLYSIGIPCARGRPTTGYVGRPDYVPVSFFGATAESSDGGLTLATACADTPNGVLDATLSWSRPLTAADAASFRSALTYLHDLIGNARSGAQTLPLFSPPRARVGLLSTTGAWNFAIGQSTANETLLIQEWPAEPLMAVRLAYSEQTQRCDETGLERSTAPKPDWAPATFYPRVARVDSGVVLCADVGGHALMVQTVEQDTYGPSDLARLGAFLLMVTAALSN